MNNARLWMVRPPPQALDDPVHDALSLHHLAAAFPTATRPIAAFQEHCQAGIVD